MAENAIVFAMANPTPEIDPVIASRHAAVVATGRSDFPNQINNVLAFPGFFRGLLDAGASDITPEMLVAAAEAIANRVADDELNASYIIPSVFDPHVAADVALPPQLASSASSSAQQRNAAARQRLIRSQERTHEMAITVTDPRPIERAEEILTPKALAFVEELHKRFAGTRDELLEARDAKRERVARTGSLDFLPETQDVRDGDWKVATAPAALQDRRVEMTGPASPAKMAINALNSGAKVWLADLEDASTPTWANVIDAILNLRDAATGTLSYTSPEGKEYTLRTDAPLAVVVARPRGWHMQERHLLIDGEPAVGALVDFGLHFFHIAKQLVLNGQGPYYYLPKMESHLEARLWNDVFVFAQDFLGIDQGTIRATVLIETIPAAFEMDEILYELRDHASGLNAGRWDYLFSIIKYFRDAGEEFVLPDRATVAMTAPFMRAYTELLVKTCHKRGAFAMGGMAAVIPNRRAPRGHRRRPSTRSARTRPARPTTASTAPGWPTRTWSPSAGKCSTPSSASARTSWTSSAPRFR